MKTLIVSALLALGLQHAWADPREVEKVRKFYREHNLDFFGELIADQNDIMADEKRHAKIELLADDARTNALKQLEMLLKTARGPMEAELLIRKATLFSDRSRTATYFQNNPFKASKLKSPQTYLEQSIQAFRQVETRFPGHPKMDIVVFSIGYNFSELKKVDDAYRYYDRLVSKFPESPLVGDARLAMAEILFDKRKFADSLHQLREIVKMDHPRLKNFAQYKMAWTYYNMADLDSAMVSLEKVIEGVNSVMSNGAMGVQRARLELRKEALHDLVAFYAENGNKQASDAMSYFAKMGATPAAIAEDYAAARAKRLAGFEAKKQPIPEEETDAFKLTEPEELLFRLTQVYRDQGKHQNSMLVAEAIIAKLTHHPRTPALYRLRAEAAEKLRRRDLVIAELERIAKLVESDLPAPSDFKNGLPTDQLSSIPAHFADPKSEIKIELAKMPELKAEAPSEARDYYRRNLSKMALDLFKDFTNFFHGEWMKTQNHDTSSQAMAAYDLAVKTLLEPWHGHAVEECLELRYRRAQLRYALKKWDAAAQDYHWLSLRRAKDRDEILRGEISSLENLLKESPVKIAKGSMNPLHERLFTAYDDFLAFNLSNAKLREIAAGILAASARLAHEYGNDEEALHRMTYYSTRFHDGKDAIALTRDVLVLLEKAERWENLRDFADTLIDSGHYKSDAIGKDLSKSLEFAHLKLLEKLERDQDWKKAAREFADFAKKHPASSFVSQALIKSANAALQLKDNELAVARLEEATGAPDAAIKLQAWMGLEPFYKKAFQWKKLAALYGQLAKLGADAKARDAAKKNLAALSELDASSFIKVGENLVSADKDLGKTLAAQEAFERTTKEFREMRFVKSNNNPAGNFKKKADLHAKLASGVEKVADSAPASLKGGAAIWANIVKAELLIEFAETLETAALPSALAKATDVDKKAYRDTIEGQAKELREKAHSMVMDAAKLIAAIDYPVTLESRLNKLLEHYAAGIRFNRAPFAPIWSKRPVITESAKDAREFDERVAALGVEILSSDDSEKAQDRELKLARAYAENALPGYAYAVLERVNLPEASKLKLIIDLSRLPKALRESAASDRLDAQGRWDLARYLAGARNTAAKADKAFSDDERKWFDDAIAALLRPNQASVEEPKSRLSAQLTN